ncbi:MAG: PspC domain-containing protein [Alloprevotella sp.]|nr:PspC domain-containing protein [Alloprevotella sp.]
MKKNITINLFGSLYNIDEDAYELLDKYLQNMKTYFSKREGGEEIAGDIECRVAELLAENKAAGVEAVTIEHIQDIIGRIGNPEQMDDADAPETQNAAGGSTPPPPPYHEEKASRKLFRDTEDRMLGGVLSGLTHYFGGTDALPWRIIFVLLCVMSWSGLAIVYLILWAILPEARTAEERLQMSGRPVNTRTLNEEIMRGVDKTRNFINNPATQSRARGCLSGILDVIVFCLKGFCILLLGGLLLAAAIFVCILLAAGLFGATELGAQAIGDDSLAAFVAHAPTLRWWLLALAVSSITIIAMPLYALIRSFTRRPEAAASSAATKTAGVVVWLLALAIAIASGITAVNIMERVSNTIDSEKQAVDLAENTREGRYLTGDSWDYLQDSGWQIVKLEGADDDIVGRGEDPITNNDMWMDFLRLKQEDATSPMSYQMEKRLVARPGHYRVAALVRTDGQGNAFYAQLGSETILREDIVASRPDTTDVARKAFENVWGITLSEEQLEEVREHKWKFASYSFNVARQDTLRYGFSNLPELNSNPWTANKFSAAYMKIERTSE